MKRRGFMMMVLTVLTGGCIVIIGCGKKDNAKQIERVRKEAEEKQKENK